MKTAMYNVNQVTTDVNHIIKISIYTVEWCDVTSKLQGENDEIS